MNFDDMSLEHQLFQTVVNLVGAEGGDGWGLIVSKRYKELADEFDKWRKTNRQASDYFRDDSENHILFSDHSNENIGFTNDRLHDATYNYTDDVVVRWG